MGPLRLKTLALIALLFGLTVGSKIAYSQITRDQQAIAVLQQAISAMGGSDNIAGITTAAVSGHLTWSHDGQRSTRQFLTQFRFSNNSVSFRRELTDENGTTIFASGRQKPVFQAANNNAHRFGAHVALAASSFETPAVLLSLELANPNCELMYIAADPGQPLHVRTEDEANETSQAVTSQDWYFDPNTLLPIRVVYKSPDVNDPSIYAKTTLDYLGFQTIASIAFPTEIRSYIDGQLDTDSTIEAAQVNIGLPQDFDMPEN